MNRTHCRIRFVGCCGLVVACAAAPAYADCPPHSQAYTQVGDVVHCKCDDGYQKSSGGCVPAAPPANAAQCVAWDSRIDAMKGVASRASLALDAYSFFDDNQDRPGITPWQAPWKAPSGYTLLSNDILQLREMLPDMDSTLIKKFIAPDDSQYRAAIYRDDASGTIFLVFRGTDMTKNNNDWWKANIPNELGEYTGYFAKAAVLATDLKQYTDAHGLALECVGHSLAGGMCVGAAVHAHIPATVFNAETVHSSALPQGDEIRTADDLVVDYVTAGEAVTSLQAMFFVPAPGIQVPLPDWPSGPISPIERHGMSFVRLSVQNRIQELVRDKAAVGCAP